MSDPDISEDFLSRYHVITLTINTDKPSPELDIGDIPPQAAITFLDQASSALREVLRPPTVRYDGVVIYGPEDEE